MQEQELLEKVTQNVSKPSSTFILFNQWDLVKKDGADRVKQQHLKKVDEILVQQLQVYTAKMAQNRTFFLSAEEACKVQLPASPDEQLAGKKQTALENVPISNYSEIIKL